MCITFQLIGYHPLRTLFADPSLPAINMTANSNYNGLWAKTKAAFRLIHERHLYEGLVYWNYLKFKSYHMSRNEADWFLKADDDSYIVVENLRALLRLHNHDEPLQFGCKLKQIVPSGYMSGGAGYVLSKEALRRFVNAGLVRMMPAIMRLDPRATTIPNCS